ncbi:MAG: flagellar basal-body MS-ring/collar protein FliF [Steroidobacteraceae bacterium]
MPETMPNPYTPYRVLVTLKPLLLLFGIAAAAAAGVGIVLWLRGPSYSLLYTDLADSDLATVTQSLEASGIRYRLEPGSKGISVPAAQLDEARLKLAARGTIASGNAVAAMAGDTGFGSSQLLDNARYQSALETELGRTIASLQAISAARVHLAIPASTSFVRGRQSPRASVVVQVRPGRGLSSDQVLAIVNLVASSIPDLSPESVSVIDQSGRLLSVPDSKDEFALRDQQFEFARRMEEQYAKRIEDLLAPIVGAGRVRAQVVAQLDMTSTEEAREQYGPQSQVVRSEQLSEQSSNTGADAGGVPGSLTNQPPESGVALPPGSEAATTATSPGANGSQSRESTRNYEIDRTLAYTRNPAGKLRRLSVAVLVDNIRKADSEGKITEETLPPEELDRLTALVRDAVGFDAQRGDSVSVINAPFSGEPLPALDDAIEALPIWKQPWILEIAKLVLGVVLALVLMFAVIRPMLRAVFAPPPALATAGSGGATNAELVGASATGGAMASQPTPALAYDQQVAEAKTAVGQDPKRVAQVVKTWVNENE